ncbi:hypothetical protein NDU88_005768 [Pleurodeles waltl]|uniref:Transposase n=1 Tax=Pleurodeles waltl TaxID=8319 RepID=A0AAV7RN05_PLEWA|nr:hypothetical protein NDU88_005768 [Pleurodeles waltl]
MTLAPNRHIYLPKRKRCVNGEAGLNNGAKPVGKWVIETKSTNRVIWLYHDQGKVKVSADCDGALLGYRPQEASVKSLPSHLGLDVANKKIASCKVRVHATRNLQLANWYAVRCLRHRLRLAMGLQ